jgi:thiamine pyrophosphate-dependent acetolactate synthase large subunit-like protein
MAGRFETSESPAFEVVARLLLGFGVDTVFSLLGSSNYLLVQRLVDGGARHVWARHESGVVSAADGWARASGRVGVCTVHQGPGLVNAVTTLTEAVRASTPLVVIAGESPTEGLSLDNQRIDQVAFVAATGAGHERVLRGASAAAQTYRAWHRAIVERRPIVLILPVDVQHESCFSDLSALLPPTGVSIPDPPSIERAVQLLLAAERPVIVGGRGLLDGEKEGLDLAERIGAVLATSAPAKGLFGSSPWCVGISGGFASPSARTLISAADLVLTLGAGLTEWTASLGDVIGRPGQTVVTVNDDITSIAGHRTPTLGLFGDAAATARALTAALPRESRTGYRSAASQALIADPGWHVTDESRDGLVDPRLVIQRLDDRLPDARTIVTDGGRTVGWIAMHTTSDGPRGFVFCQSFMSLGIGLPSGLGASLARPGRLTVIFTGDGGLMMNLNELDSVISQADPVLIVALDDGAAGAEVHIFGPLGEPVDNVVLGTRDYAGVARALGAQGATLTDILDLDDAVGDWLADPMGAFLLDVKIDGAIPEHWSQHVLGR